MSMHDDALIARVAARLERTGHPVGEDAVAAVFDALMEDHVGGWWITRTDGEPLFGEYMFYSSDGPHDWESAEMDSDDHDEAVEYRLELLVPIAYLARVYADGVHRS